VPRPEAIAGIAKAFMVDMERAAALVALVPRGVRRGLARAEADETAAALKAIGARVEVLPAGEAPALVASLRPPPASGARGTSVARPRVQLKRAARPALSDDEPAYGVGSSAYVPLVVDQEAADAAAPSEPALAPDAAPEHLEAPERDPNTELPDTAEFSDDGERISDGFFEDELELGSLIPGPDATAEAATAELQLELARLPKVQVIPLRAGSAQEAPAAPPRRPRPEPRTTTPGHAPKATPAEPAAARDPRKLALLAGGVVVLALGALLLRGALAGDANDAEPSGSDAPASAGPTDASLLAQCDGLALVDARTWLRLGEDNRLGTMSSGDARVFVARLSGAGGVTAQVALPSDSSTHADLLLLQHTPFHAEALMEAATVGDSGVVVAPQCVSMSARYMLIRFGGCPEAPPR
jgi:hypothetical protein